MDTHTHTHTLLETNKNTRSCTYRCKYTSSCSNVCHYLCYPPRSIIVHKFVEKFLCIRPATTQKKGKILVGIVFSTLVQKKTKFCRTGVPSRICRTEANIDTDKITTSRRIQRKETPKCHY